MSVILNDSENEIELVDAEDDEKTTDKNYSSSSDIEDNPSFQELEVAQESKNLD